MRGTHEARFFVGACLRAGDPALGVFMEATALRFEGLDPATEQGEIPEPWDMTRGSGWARRWHYPTSGPNLCLVSPANVAGIVAAAAMAPSSVSVIVNALRLRTLKVE